MPMVFSGASSQEGLTTPGVFAVTGGYPATLGAFALHAKEQGFKKVAHIVVDVPAATGGAKALGGIVFKNAGVGYEVIPAAQGTPDLTSQLQAAVSGGADAVMVTGDAVFCTSFLKAYKTLGLKIPRYVIATCVDKAVVDAVPDVLGGSFGGTLRAPGPEDAIYGAAAKKYDSSIDPDPTVSSGQADGWASLMGLVNALKGYTGA